jgi:D-lactate dehydrogenase
MKVAFFSAKSYDKTSFEQVASNFDHQLTYYEVRLDQDTVYLAQGNDAICTFVNDQLDQKVLKKLAELEVKNIVLRCAGYNQVDLKSADKLGIRICRVPAYSPEAVAEHALALLMTVVRKTHKAYNRVRENNFSLEGLIGINIHKQTVGVIGTGAIGSAFCKIMLGMGCKVIAFDHFENEDLKTLGVSYVKLAELIAKSSIISLHCPLTTETKHLINSESLSKMQEGVAIINTSRGALIDTKAMIKSLKKKKVGYLGIDVYEQEEDLFFQDLSAEILQDEDIARLMNFPNVLITGHQAYLTKEALHQIASTTLTNLNELESDKDLTNQIQYQEK